MKESIFLFLQTWVSNDFMVVFLGALPVFELRLAIPAGVLLLDVGYLRTFLLAVTGNVLVVLPLLLLWRYIIDKLEMLPGFLGNALRWWFKRVDQKAETVRKWGFWGLIFFVAIPLPVTGAWTGTVAATLVGMRYKYAFMAIFLGVVIAGIIVTGLTFFADELIVPWIKF